MEENVKELLKDELLKNVSGGEGIDINEFDEVTKLLKEARDRTYAQRRPQHKLLWYIDLAVNATSVSQRLTNIEHAMLILDESKSKLPGLDYIFIFEKLYESRKRTKRQTIHLQ